MEIKILYTYMMIPSYVNLLWKCISRLLNSHGIKIISISKNKVLVNIIVNCCRRVPALCWGCVGLVSYKKMFVQWRFGTFFAFEQSDLSVCCQHEDDMGPGFLATQWGPRTYERQNDKTNKVIVRPVKTQISLGIRPVWSESSLSVWRKFGSLATHWAHSKDSDQPGHPPNLISGCPGWSESSLSTLSFYWFCHVVAHMFLWRTDENYPSVIIKYPPYLFFLQLDRYFNITLEAAQEFYKLLMSDLEELHTQSEDDMVL